MSKFSVRKPYTVIVAVALIIILGVVSLLNMQTDLIPSFEFPYAIVITTYPGASPEQVELSVTNVIEQSMASVSRLKEISSSSNENYSMIMMEFMDETNLDYAAVEMRENLDKIVGYLPDGCGDPTIMKINPNIIPLMAVSADMSGADRVKTTDVVNDTVLPALKSVEGVASVSAAGLVERDIKVNISQEKIDKLNRDILEKIDEQLAEAQDELDDAQHKLNNGKSQLKSQKAIQMNTIAKAEKAISSGKQQLDTAKSELTANKEQLGTALEQTKSGLEEISSQLQAAKDSKPAADAEVEKRQKAYDSLKAQLEGTEPTEEQKKQLDDAKTALDSAKQQQSQINGTIDQLTAKKAELEGTAAELEKNKAAVDGGLEEISKNEEKLKSQEAMVANGKKQLTSALGKAEGKLHSAQSQLDDAMEEFEKQRDEAIENADMESVITADLVSTLINAQNISFPAGYVKDGDDSYLVRVGDDIKSEQALREMPLLSLAELDMDITLDDVADITTEDNADNTVTKVNGNEAILITLQKQTEYSTAEVAKSVREKMEQLNEENEGLTMTALMDQGVYVDVIIGSVFENLIYGAILAVIILILFLRDWKVTLVIALSIPISLIFAIVLMYFSGVTLNLISMSGLALAVGMLVDNSIVVIENIYRMRQEGKSARDAAIYGAKQVAGAIISSTLTTCAVFLPIVFTTGITKQLFTDMGLTITYSLLASLIIALTFIPMACSGALTKSMNKKHKLFDRFCNWYGKVLAWCLKVKWVPITLVLALFVVSIIGAKNMGTQFFPQMQGDQMSVTLRMDDELKFDQATQIACDAAERIKQVEGVTTVGLSMTDSKASSLGNASSMAMSFATSARGGNGTSLYVLLDTETKRSFDEIKDDIIRSVSDLDCEASVAGQSMDISMMTGKGASINIIGRDLDVLQQTAKDLAEKIRQIEGTDDVSDGFEKPAEELRITVDKAEALRKGMTTGEVYSQIADLLKQTSSSATLSIESEDYPVILSSDFDEEKDLDYLETSWLTNRDGKYVRLMSIVEITQADGYTKISHENQQRFVTVTAGIAEGYNIGKVSAEINSLLDSYEAPKGTTIKTDGENEAIIDALKNVMLMVLMAIAFVYLIMVAQFQSLKSPFIVLFTLPLAFTGAYFALAIAGFDLSVIAAVGMVLLVGVVVNNGIVFVDYVNQLREGGMKKRDALILTGKTRLRPILMTALTTIISMITMVIGLGSGTEMVQPMAVTVLGGLIYATALTLIIVPIIYDLFNRENYKRKGIFSGLERGISDKNFRMNADGTTTVIDDEDDQNEMDSEVQSVLAQADAQQHGEGENE